jgi:hypothetical protein
VTEGIERTEGGRVLTEEVEDFEEAIDVSLLEALIPCRIIQEVILYCD